MMLAVAYVLITTTTGKEHNVLQRIQLIPGLSDIHQLFGQFDLIARVEAKDYDVMCDVVLEKIRTIPGVTSTRTLICASFRRD